MGRQIARLRAQHGVTADQLASAARFIGLKWHRSTVATIEGAGRGLTAEELLALPLIFEKAGAQVSFPDLVAGDMTIGLLPLSAADIGRLVAGEAVDFRDPLARTPRNVSDMMRGLATLHLASQQEAEQKAARRLGQRAFEVTVMAFRLWRRSLTDQREVEARKLLEADAARIEAEGGNVEAWLRTALPAARRKATHRLLTELRSALESPEYGEKQERRRRLGELLGRYPEATFNVTPAGLEYIIPPTDDPEGLEAEIKSILGNPTNEAR